MSIRFPETNCGIGVPLIIDVPAGAFPRYSSATDFIFGMWVKPGDWHDGTNADHIITFGGATASVRNVAITVQFNPAWGTGLISGWACNNGTNYMQGISTQFVVPVTPKRTPFLVGLIHANAKLHMYFCPVGGSAVIVSSSVASTGFHHTDSLFTRISSNSAGSLAFPGCVEHAFHIRGTVPLDGSNVPVLSNLTDLANGTLSFDGLIALMTNTPQKVSYYPLTKPGDNANAWQAESGSSGAGNANPQNAVTANGAIFTQGPTLRPNGLTPTPCMDLVSNVAAGETTGSINIPGGTYNNTILGDTAASIEARLIDEAGTEARPWQVIDAAPSGGTFTGGTFTGVPVAATWYQAEYRAKNAGGTVLATTSEGVLRGLGTCILVGGQSQMEQLLNSGGITLTLPTTPCRFLVSSVRPNKTTGADRWAATQWMPVNSTLSTITNRFRDGCRAFAREINAKRPGLPIQIIDLCVSSTSLRTHVTAAGIEEMHNYLADAAHVDFGYLLFMYGHSDDTDSAQYALDMTTYVSQVEARFGTAQKVLVGTTQRCPAQANTLQQDKRKAMHDWLIGKDTDKYAWGGSYNSVYTEDGTHPADAVKGDIRAGTILGWHVMMANGDVTDKPVKLLSAAKSGTTCILTFGEATW